MLYTGILRERVACAKLSIRFVKDSESDSNVLREARVNGLAPVGQVTRKVKAIVGQFAIFVEQTCRLPPPVAPSNTFLFCSKNKLQWERRFARNVLQIHCEERSLIY